jgi:hypothetical protein
MNSQLLLPAAALLTLVPAASAQDVTFRGKVEDVSGTTNQFVVDCTGTRLTSGLFNLNLFVGQQVEISGDWNGSTANPSVDVTAIAPVPESFEIGGGGKIGQVNNLTFGGQPGAAAFGFVSTQTGFTPINGGVIFLGTGNIVFQTAGTIGGAGVLQLPMPIPNNPALIGLDIFGQGALSDAAGNLTLTNPDCKQLDN